MEEECPLVHISSKVKPQQVDHCDTLKLQKIKNLLKLKKSNLFLRAEVKKSTQTFG